MLELAGSEALGVDVGQFLELQRPLQRHRIAHMTAQEQHRAGINHESGDLADPVQPVQHSLDLGRHLAQVLHHRLRLVGVGAATKLGEVQAQDVAGRDLGQEGLGGGNRDLRAGVGVQHRVRLTRNRRAVGVADGDDARAQQTRVLDGHQCVHGLPGLRDRDHQGALVDDRVAVAELVGQVDLTGDPGPVLDGVLGDHSGIGSGTARDDHDLVDGAKLRLVHA